MNWILIPLGVLAGLSWISSLIHWILALGHLSGRTSLGAMIFRGIEAFRSDNFTPEGQVLQRRFYLSFLVFILSVLLGVVVGAVAASLTNH